MKISVLIIAHNEEKYISKCILSVLNQTQKPDEVVVVVHNSTDKTLTNAEEFPVTIIPFNENPGIVGARIEGLKHVSGDIILCIDGDSFAENNWIETMVNTLVKDNNVLVGSWVKFKGTIWGILSNLSNKYFCASKNKKSTMWIWGPSFAFGKKDKKVVEEILQKSILLSQKLNLSRNPDDYWLSMLMYKSGNIEVTNKTWVIQNSKETSTIKAIIRNRENIKNGRLIRKFLEK